jgi:hypothetical protein
MLVNLQSTERSRREHRGYRMPSPLFSIDNHLL